MRIRWSVVVTGAMCLSLARLEGQQPVIRDSAGQLNTMPLVPSHRNVFGSDGA